MEENLIDLGKLLAAVVAGAVIGLERETHDKPAGFRTMILICLGAALFTVIGVRLGEGSGFDRARIAAQIVTGVGFLGAGAIIQFRGNVIGLTTAATIWVVASVGMAFGAGAFLLGTVATVITAAVLFGLEFAESRIARWRTRATYEIEAAPDQDLQDIVARLLKQARVHQDSWTVSKKPDGVSGRLTVTGPSARLSEFEEALARSASIRELKRL